jgi:predicted ester cyclase
MSAEDLRSLVKRWYDVLNREDWEDHIDQFDPNQDWWEEWKDGHREFRKSFPDYHFTIDKIIAEEEYVAHFGKVEATFQEEYPHWELRGIAPTGEKISWDEAWWWEVVDGKFGDGFIILDSLGRLQQIGVLPMPEEANQE